MDQESSAISSVLPIPGQDKITLEQADIILIYKKLETYNGRKSYNLLSYQITWSLNYTIFVWRSIL